MGSNENYDLVKRGKLSDLSRLRLFHFATSEIHFLNFLLRTRFM